MENLRLMQCSCCGGQLVLENGSYYCRSCGNRFEEPKIDDKMFIDLAQADNERQSVQFAKAKTIYNKIIETYPNEDLSDAYWGLFLCEHNVVFETDGNGEKFPSFYRINNTGVEDTPSYNKAISYALKNHKPDKMEIFSNLGDKIENARRMYLDISQKTKPFDVFICFKNSDGNGNHTPDRQLAMDIYNRFSGTYNIFFSEKTLKDIKSSYRDYEPNIYYGLYTSKVMLLICSRREYIESQWLKNEWSRFTQINRQGENEKCIIPIFTDGFDPNDLPEELWHNQGVFDDRNLIDNLDAQLESIIHPVDALAELRKEQERQMLEMQRKQEEEREKLKREFQSMQKSSGGGGQVNSAANLIDAIEKFISIRNFNKAKESIDNLKKISPNAFEVYWYSMFYDNACADINEICKIGTILDCENYKNSKLFASSPENKNLINLLNTAHEDYFNQLVSDIEDYQKNANLLKFNSAYTTLKSFRPSCFETEFYGMFYDKKLLKYDDIKKVPLIVDHKNFVQAKKLMTTQKQKDLVHDFEVLCDKYFEELCVKIKKEVETKSSNFNNTYLTLKAYKNTSFEKSFYALYHDNKTNDFDTLYKIPNVILNQNYTDAVKYAKTNDYKKTVEELKQYYENYFKNKLVELEDSLSSATEFNVLLDKFNNTIKDVGVDYSEPCFVILNKHYQDIYWNKLVEYNKNINEMLKDFNNIKNSLSHRNLKDIKSELKTIYGKLYTASDLLENASKVNTTIGSNVKTKINEIDEKEKIINTLEELLMNKVELLKREMAEICAKKAKGLSKKVRKNVKNLKISNLWIGILSVYLIILGITNPLLPGVMNFMPKVVNVCDWILFIPLVLSIGGIIVVAIVAAIAGAIFGIGMEVMLSSFITFIPYVLLLPIFVVIANPHYIAIILIWVMISNTYKDASASSSAKAIVTDYKKSKISFGRKFVNFLALITFIITLILVAENILDSMAIGNLPAGYFDIFDFEFITTPSRIWNQIARLFTESIGTFGEVFGGL